MAYTLQFQKEDKLASDITDTDLSASLLSGNFADDANALLVVDYDKDNAEIIRCTISGTTLSIAERGFGGTSAVAHTANANIIMAFLPAHYSAVTREDGWVEAAETWAYSSADDPTFVITVPSDATLKYSLGDRIRLKQGGAYLYFIITKVEATALTVYGGTDYDLTDAAITNAAFSKVKSPLGFPLAPDKWTVEVTNVTLAQQLTPMPNTWYNVGSISITVPIGVWDLEYQVNAEIVRGATTTTGDFLVTLSTANNSASDNQFTCSGYLTAGAGTFVFWYPNFRHKVVTLTTKTIYYLNGLAAETSVAGIYFRGDTNRGTTMLRAKCAYL